MSLFSRSRASAVGRELLIVAVAVVGVGVVDVGVVGVAVVGALGAVGAVGVVDVVGVAGVAGAVGAVGTGSGALHQRERERKRRGMPHTLGEHLSEQVFRHACHARCCKISPSLLEASVEHCYQALLTA